MVTKYNLSVCLEKIIFLTCFHFFKVQVYFSTFLAKNFQ